MDILADGRMDYEDDVLKELDIVVASPHVSLKQDAAKATDRILRAIDNRYVNIIGHPTGRLINRREGLPLDFDQVFKAAAANGTRAGNQRRLPAARPERHQRPRRRSRPAACSPSTPTPTAPTSFDGHRLRHQRRPPGLGDTRPRDQLHASLEGQTVLRGKAEVITAEGAEDAEEEMLNAKLSAECRMESLVPRFRIRHSAFAFSASSASLR